VVTGYTYLGTVVGATGSGVIGGLMFAFSTAMMPALRVQPDGEAMRVMQRINTKIQNPLFLLAFVGTLLVCLALAISTLLTDQPGAALRGVGALLYVVGAFGVTMVVNVPLNSKLDAQADDEAGRRYWQEFLRAWLPWHHLRAVAAVAGCVMMIVSLT
jgi:uncharacterized membrane protein